MDGKPNNALAQMLQQAFMALRAKQFDNASQIATQVLKSNRADRNAVLILAHALLGQNRAGEAIAPLERATRRGNDPEIETLLGHTLCGARRTIDGIAQLRRTAARRPPYLPAFQELAGQLSRNGQLNEAVEVIEDALALSPASVDLMLDVGRLSLQNNDRARARAILGAARLAAPTRLDVLMELGKATLLDGEYAEAAEIYRLILVQRPDDITSRANRAICLMEMGNRHCGESALRKVLHARPQMLGRAAFTLASTPHGRFFFRPTAAAEFLERKPA